MATFISLLKILSNAIIVVLGAIAGLSLMAILLFILLSLLPLKPSKCWLTLEFVEWDKFFLLRLCNDVYRKRYNNNVSKEFLSGIFDESLNCVWYSKACKAEVRKMLRNEELVRKYMGKKTFSAEDYRNFYSDYSTYSAIVPEIKNFLPPMFANNDKAVQMFRKGIEAGLFDKSCKPIDTNRKLYFYWALADTIWREANLEGSGDKTEIFARLWLGSFLQPQTDDKSFKKLKKSYSSLLNYLKNESNKFPEIEAEIKSIMR